MRTTKWTVVFCSMALACTPVMADMFTANYGGGTLTMDFVAIPGSASDGYGGQSAGDFTTTNISHDYRIATTEVSQDMYYKMMDGSGSGVNTPKVYVTWYEAAKFVNALNEAAGAQVAYNFDGSGDFQVWSNSDDWADGTNQYRHKDAIYFLPTVSRGGQSVPVWGR